ncbi:MAG: hypothetical protein HY922_09565 [Elusimicrobia bacterium]|nr:hypothetical protein [Elusimicrobiota bacterium]
MRRVLAPCLLLCAQAAAAAVGFELSPATSTVLLGAPVEISGTAQVPAGRLLTLALSGRSTGAFELLDVQISPGSEGSGPNGGRAYSIKMTAAAFELGPVLFPQLPWSLKPPGGEAEIVLSPPIPLVVVPPESAKKGVDIRDIKGPLSPSAWPWILAALALLCAALYPLHRRLRARSLKGGWAAQAPDTLTPEQKALDDLGALFALGLPVKEFYDRLSDILRLYLSRRYGLDALQMTTHDLLRALRGGQADTASTRQMTKALLGRCDLAKFARFAPADPERLRDVEAAKHIVRSSAKPEAAKTNS